MTELYSDEKAKPWTIFFFFVMALGVLIVSAQMAQLIFDNWYSLIVGIVLMITAIPLHYSGKKEPKRYFASVLINATGCGFSIAAYYLERKIAITWQSILFSCLLPLAILFAVSLIVWFFSQSKRMVLLIAFAMTVALLIVCFIFWIKTDRVIFSFFFFCLLLLIFYLSVFGISVNHPQRFVLHDLSYGSFGAFILITIVVAVILSGGDILDGLDFSTDGSSRPKHRAKHLTPKR